MLKSMLDDDLVEDLGFMDINSFCQLQSRFDNLIKSHENLKKNVTMLTKLLTNFMSIQHPLAV